MQLRLWATGVTLAVLFAGVAGCKGKNESPMAPSPNSQFAGTWGGFLQDNTTGGATLILNLTESNGRVTGAWQVNFSLTLEINGVLSGSATETPLVFTMTCGGAGFGSLNPVRNGDTMTGTYFTLGCAGLSEGVFEITRQ